MWLIRIVQLMKYRIDHIGKWWIPILLITTCDIVLHTYYKKRVYDWVKYTVDLVLVIILLLSSMVFSRSILPREYWNSNYSFDILSAFKPGPGIYGFIDTWFEAFLNILIFIPVGYIMTRLFNSKTIAIELSGALIITIELLQLSTNRGFFELSDIILNTCGAIIGCYYYRIKRLSVFYLLTKQFKKIWKRLQNLKYK